MRLVLAMAYELSGSMARWLDTHLGLRQALLLVATFTGAPLLVGLQDAAVEHDVLKTAVVGLGVVALAVSFWAGIRALALRVDAMAIVNWVEWQANSRTARWERNIAAVAKLGVRHDQMKRDLDGNRMTLEEAKARLEATDVELRAAQEEAEKMKSDQPLERMDDEARSVQGHRQELGRLARRQIGALYVAWIALILAAVLPWFGLDLAWPQVHGSEGMTIGDGQLELAGLVIGLVAALVMASSTSLGHALMLREEFYRKYSSLRPGGIQLLDSWGGNVEENVFRVVADSMRAEKAKQVNEVGVWLLVGSFMLQAMSLIGH